MIFSIKQELFKLRHRKIAWITPLLMMIFLMFFSLTYLNGAPEDIKLIMISALDAPDFVPLFLTIVAASIFSMEYQNNSILTLLYKAQNKGYVFLAKFLVIFLYDLFLHLITIGATLLLSITYLHVDWMQIYLYHQPLWENMLKTVGLNIVASMLIVSLLCILSCLINNNALVVALSLGILFMGTGLSHDIIRLSNIDIAKWNPFNMLVLAPQYYNYISYHPVSHLTNIQMTIGSLIYCGLFFALGYKIFSHKRF